MGLRKNKKANVFGVILIAFILFTVGFIVANFLKAPIDDARTNLNCANAGSITDGTKLECIMVDSALIYWIILIISLAGGAILDKVLV